MGWVEDFQRAMREGINQGLAQIADDVVEAAKPIISREAIDRADLLKSGEARRVDDSTWQAAWTAAHAPYVEYGTRPHWPPAAPIREWVKRNMRVEDSGRAVIKPRRKRGTRTPHDAEIDRMTYLIQRKIAAKGTEPVRFATRAAHRVAPTVADTMSKAITRRLGARFNRGGAS